MLADHPAVIATHRGQWYLQAGLTWECCGRCASRCWDRSANTHAPPPFHRKRIETGKQTPSAKPL